MSNSLQPHGLYCPWNSPGQNTRVSSISLLQGIFPTHRSYPGLPHCRQILYQLSHKGINYLLIKTWILNGTQHKIWTPFQDPQVLLESGPSPLLLHFMSLLPLSIRPSFCSLSLSSSFLPQGFTPPPTLSQLLPRLPVHSLQSTHCNLFLQIQEGSPIDFTQPPTPKGAGSFSANIQWRSK